MPPKKYNIMFTFNLFGWLRAAKRSKKNQQTPHTRKAETTMLQFIGCCPSREGGMVNVTTPVMKGGRA